VLLKLIVNRVEVELDLAGVTETAYQETESLLSDNLGNPKVKNREAIAVAFLHVLRQCPEANASDLWHHVVYRLYCEAFRKYRPEDPKQSWVRASGDALERFVQMWYTPVMEPEGIKITALLSRDQKRAALKEMSLEAQVGDSKLDVALYLTDKDAHQIFGGVHVKASLAERVSDDVPASRAMMGRGLFSPLWTLDVKSFPPTKGIARVRDLINRGELGTPDRPSEKRKYIEEHGDFDGCYSANARTVPSSGGTTSGQRIHVLRLSQQPDDFAAAVIRFSQRRRGARLLEPDH